MHIIFDIDALLNKRIFSPSRIDPTSSTSTAAEIPPQPIASQRQLLEHWQR